MYIYIYICIYILSLPCVNTWAHNHYNENTMKRRWHILINNFFLSVGFNLNNYKYIVALLHFIPIYFIWCNESVHSKTSFNCNYYLFIVSNRKCLLSVIFFFFNSTLWIIDFIIRITHLCYLLHSLTSCSINWCSGFVTNLVVIIQITQLFILEFHLNLTEPMPKAYLFLIVAKMLLQKASINSTFIIINLLIFVVWITEIYGSLYCLTFCSIDRCGGSTMNWGCFTYSYCTTGYLILVPQTSKQAKLSISCSQNIAAETRYQF